MGNLDTLITACNSLKELKYKEGDYKRAAVAIASNSISNIKSAGLVKQASPLLALLALAGIGTGAYSLGRNPYVMDNLLLGLNRINSNLGQGAVIRKANSGIFSPGRRDEFILSRLGTNAAYSRLRDAADTALLARRNFFRRRFERMAAESRGNDIITNARYDASRGYTGAMRGMPPMPVYGPYSYGGSSMPYGGYYGGTYGTPYVSARPATII